MKKDSGQIGAMTLFGQHLDLSVMRRRKGVLESEGSRALELPASWEDFEESPEVLAELKTVLEDIKGLCTLGIPSDQALLRVVDLPTIEDDELDGMVELQVEKIAPFPMEQLQVGYEVLHRTDSATRVLMTAVKRDALEKHVAPLDAAGVVIDRVDLNVMGWWTLIQAVEATVTNERKALLLLDHDATELIILQDGVPVVIRTLGGHGATEAEAWNQELCEETAYTLAALEAEWGGEPLRDLMCWHWDSKPQRLMDRLIAETGLDVHAFHFEELPPLSQGLARRAARESPNALNLALPEWAQRRTSRRTRKLVGSAVGAVLLVWIVGLFLLFFLVRNERSKETRLAAQAEEAETEAANIRRLKDRVDALELRLDRSRSALECLLDISQRLPEGVEINAWSYRKNLDVALRGQAGDANSVHNFVENMENSDVFSSIKTEDISSKMVSNQRRTTYRMTAMLPRSEGEQE